MFPLSDYERSQGYSDCTFCGRPGFCKDGECNSCRTETREKEYVKKYGNTIPEPAAYRSRTFREPYPEAPDRDAVSGVPNCL